MILVCRQCSQQFDAPKSRYLFCSKKCADASRAMIPAAGLALLADEGAKAAYIAARYGVTPPSVSRALRRQGLHERWKERRYA